MAITVKYAEQDLLPAPYVSKSIQGVDAGALRLGLIEEYTINGQIAGGSGYHDVLLALSKSPGKLQISSDDGLILEKDGFITSFSIPKTNFLSSSGLFPYSAQFKVYNVHSKIKDPVFSFSYSQNEDSSVSLSLKTSAVGLSGLGDAKAFVGNLLDVHGPNGFTPLLTFESFTPPIGAARNFQTPPSTPNWSLVSAKTTVDRLKFSYSDERTYVCSPKGVIDPDFLFSEITNVSHEAGIDKDYDSWTFDSKLKILAEGAKYLKNQDWATVEAKLSAMNPVEKIAKYYMRTLGASDTEFDNNMILDNISISKNSGAGEVGLKFTLLSGKSEDFKGYFDYSVSTEEDFSTQDCSMKLDGSFISKGDLTNRKQFLEKWISAQFTPIGVGQAMTISNGPNLTAYVNGLTGMAAGLISGKYGIDSFSVDHNNNLAKFKIEANFDNKIRLLPASEMNFSVDIKAAVPVYKFIPAANIEGHYIIQDLLCKTAETATISANGKADGVPSLNGFFITGKDITKALFDNFIKKDLGGAASSPMANYKEIAPESLTINSGLADASFGIDYGIIYSGNKNYNHTAFLGINKIVAPPASTRSANMFGT